VHTQNRWLNHAPPPASTRRAACTEDQRSATARSPIRVGIVAVPPVKALDIFGPADVFGNVNSLCNGRREYEINIVSATADRIVFSHIGSPVHTDQTFRDFRGPIDTLLVAGSMAPHELRYEPELLSWLKDQSTKSRRVGSIGTGTFVFAKAGLLDGRRVTTHWNWANELARDYPRVTVDPQPIFVRDNDYFTSAGVTASIDLCLALVEGDMGKSIALAVAQMMIVFLQRAADQPQFSATLAAQAGVTEPLDNLLAWLPDHIDTDLSVDVLARRVAMSPRNFARMFRAEVGKTPGRHIEDLRLESARRQLEINPPEHRRGRERQRLHQRRDSPPCLRKAPRGYARPIQSVLCDDLAELMPIKTPRVESELLIVDWFRELLRGPVEPMGDCYDRLRFTVASSAPVSQPAIGCRGRCP